MLDADCGKRVALCGKRGLGSGGAAGIAATSTVLRRLGRPLCLQATQSMCGCTCKQKYALQRGQYKSDARKSASKQRTARESRYVHHSNGKLFEQTKGANTRRQC